MLKYFGLHIYKKHFVKQLRCLATGCIISAIYGLYLGNMGYISGNILMSILR